MSRPAARPRVRLAELVAMLSLGTDLGLGQPMEHVLRQCLIALRLAERLGLDEPQRAATYYAGLLAWVGCHVDAYEQARWFGDDIALKSDFRQVDGAGSLFAVRHLGAGLPVLERARLGIAFLGDGRRAANSMLTNHWQATDELAASLGLGETVRATLGQVFERWDGKGVPHGLRGEQILVTARLIALADVVEVFQRTAGVDAAVAVADTRSGSQFDPDLVQLFREVAPALFAQLDSTASWDAVLTSEPTLEAFLSDEELEKALESIADFADLKSPWTIGHSRGVADLAHDATLAYGLPDDDAVTVRRSGLVHDLGRLGVSNAIWDKRSPLTPAETERIRLHPYLTERMLSFSRTLAPLGTIAVLHHERLDGSGYPRGLTAESIPTAGRILAAADTYRTKVEARPHRGPLAADAVVAHLRAEVSSGRLDRDAVEAVLHAAGHKVRRHDLRPADLTPREVEVLRLVARGLSNKEIAAQLVISPKTAGNHVDHIYAKIGVSNRAMASLFAVRHGLMTDS